MNEDPYQGDIENFENYSGEDLQILSQKPDAKKSDPRYCDSCRHFIGEDDCECTYCGSRGD